MISQFYPFTAAVGLLVITIGRSLDVFDVSLFGACLIVSAACMYLAEGPAGPEGKP